MKTAKFYAYRFRIDTDHDDHEEMARVFALVEEDPKLDVWEKLELYRRYFDRRIHAYRSHRFSTHVPTR